MGVKPTSSGWRVLTGAAIGYGLTTGGSNASSIGLTGLGRRVVAPQEDGEDTEALREACLKPAVISGFLRKYDGNKFPRENIAKNVLQSQFNVPAARTSEALAIIVENAETIRAFRTMGSDRYVSLTSVPSRQPASGEVTEESAMDPSPVVREEVELAVDTAEPSAAQDQRPVNAVFVGHSKGTKILEQVKQLLELADLKAEVAVEQETAAIPVSDKVFDAMRRSDATIVCVTADAGREGSEGYEVNANVLIEIGAAYVCHDKRLVLLWDRRVKVPSNLQGLYRCEFEGEELSWEAGTKLQRALIAIKKGHAPG